MAKQRGYPDRRGMGAQSDFIAEQFVPDESYKAHQLEMVKTLLAAGVDPEQIKNMFFIQPNLRSDQNQEDEKQKNM